MPSPRPLPRILAREPTLAFLEIRRRFRALTGRELGFAHATRAIAKLLPTWQELPLEGPDGLPIYLDLRQKEGYFNGGFANTTGHMGPLLPFVRPGDVVVDVGANIGVWSRVVLAQRSLSKLFAFEPDGRNYELLKKNLSVYPQASSEPFAVGASEGAVAFSTHLDAGQNYVLDDAAALGRTRRVEMTSLDAWAQKRGVDRIDVLKVDVEGLESDVLRGATRILKELSPVVYFEFLAFSPEHGVQSPESFEILGALGYDTRAVALDGTLVPVDSPVAMSHDFIALPRGRTFNLP